MQGRGRRGCKDHSWEELESRARSWETEASSGRVDRKILGQGQGRNPHPLGDPSWGTTPPSTPPGCALGKGNLYGPLTLRGSKTLGRGQVIHSPTSRCLGSPWPRDDGSRPREAATPPAAFPPSESPLAQNT